MKLPTFLLLITYGCFAEELSGKDNFSKKILN